MKKFILLCFAIVPLSLIAQHKKERKPLPPPKWDTLYHKNEISLDVSPVIELLINYPKKNESLGLTYRHFFDKKNALRVSMRHSFDLELRDEIATRPDPISSGPGDSVLTITNHRRDYYSPDIRVGYEHRFGKRRFKFVLGADIMAGAEIVTINDHNTYYYSVMMSSQNGPVYTTVFPVTMWQNDPYMRQVNIKTGITPFIGLQIHLNKRFSINAAMMYDVYFAFPVGGINVTDNTPAFMIKATDQAIVSDISLTVHF